MVLVIWKKKEVIREIVKSLKDPGFLMKGVTQTIENEIKEQKCGFFSMLFSTSSGSLLGNLLTGKDVYTCGGVIWASEGAKETSQE